MLKFYQNYQKTLRAALSIMVVALILLTTVLLLPYGNDKKTEVAPVSFSGEYQFSPDSAFAPLPYEDGISAFWNPQITLRGNFNQPMRKGDQLFFYMQCLEVRILLNGSEIYAYGVSENLPYFMHSAGMTWSHLVLPQDITPHDEWTIHLRNQYPNNFYSAYNDFLASLQTGDSGALARAVLAQNWPIILSSILLLIFSLVILVFAIALVMRRGGVHPSIFYFVSSTLSMGLFLLLSPRYSSLLFDNPILIMQYETVCMMAGMVTLSAYFGSLMKSKARDTNDFFVLILIFVSFLCLVLQLLDLTDTYAIRTFLVITGGIMSIVLLLEIHYEISHVKEHAYRLLIWPTLIFLSLVISEALNYAFELVPPGKLVFIGFIVIASAQLFLATRYFQNTIVLAQKTEQMEKELTQGRIAIMLSQIQPHFLFNSLCVIKGLCQLDPKRAETAIEHFSDFLRGNLNSLSAAAPIAFEQELLHTKHYLELELMRFGRRLHILYQIPVTSFRIPSLTLQPIVENAVRYGVTKQKKGGTVTIATAETGSAYVVTVSDDGIGFEPAQQFSDDSTHIGIQNVRARLAAQCSGLLEIHSVIGQGTVVTITIPKEGHKNEISCGR